MLRFVVVFCKLISGGVPLVSQRLRQLFGLEKLKTELIACFERDEIDHDSFRNIA